LGLFRIKGSGADGIWNYINYMMNHIRLNILKLTDESCQGITGVSEEHIASIFRVEK
jgi:hypothetical protein